MSIEKRLSTGCTPAECYVPKRILKDFDRKGDNNFTHPKIFRDLFYQSQVCVTGGVVYSKEYDGIQGLQSSLDDYMRYQLSNPAIIV